MRRYLSFAADRGGEIHKNLLGELTTPGRAELSVTSQYCRRGLPLLLKEGIIQTYPRSLESKLRRSESFEEPYITLGHLGGSELLYKPFV